jgi:glyoxylase-like metal-dependent hydrolase (beta-lactamase superfamily II)
VTVASTLHPSAAELPLTGGQADATVTLHPLLCGEMRGPVGWFHRADGPTAALQAFGIGVPRARQLRVPIIAFLLEHPTVGPVLVDTGFHRSLCEKNGGARARNLGPVGRLLARSLRMRQDQTVLAQLSERGIDAADVSVVIMTHLHFDHASALSDFPSATVLLTGSEWNAAQAPRAYLHGYSIAQLDPRPSYRTLDFSVAPEQSRGPFARALDVFADGSVMLVSTPGHSAGHLSVIVRLKDREALIAGDAIYTMATLREGERPWRSEDAQAFEHSLLAIQAYDRENPQALIIPGHDMAAWEQLDARY